MNGRIYFYQFLKTDGLNTIVQFDIMVFNVDTRMPSTVFTKGNKKTLSVELKQ
jgi:hypothetical protein